VGGSKLSSCLGKVVTGVAMEGSEQPLGFPVYFYLYFYIKTLANMFFKGSC
jgi:hypothetical protein